MPFLIASIARFQLVPITEDVDERRRPGSEDQPGSGMAGLCGVSLLQFTLRSGLNEVPTQFASYSLDLSQIGEGATYELLVFAFVRLRNVALLLGASAPCVFASKIRGKNTSTGPWTGSTVSLSGVMVPPFELDGRAVADAE